ncbi:phosphopantetheine-binding protein [Streptomyces sp. NPDC039022]|uniref:acyl carrier protein n=1 Tax=unclassified Streptomyces TaxID=2593676 RepID=UPI0033EA57FC
MTAQQQTDIDRTVMDFLATRAPGPAPERDEDLFQSGRVNSLFALQLMSFLERAFTIELDVDDLDLSNFASIARITDFVQRKQLASDPA